MPSTPVVVEQWLALPREALLEKVRQVVKRRNAESKKIWAAVRGHSVLVAQVRGALSSLKAEVRGTRDEGMWGMWIEQARQELDQVEPAAAPAQAPAPVKDDTASNGTNSPGSAPGQWDPSQPERELTLTPQPERPRTAPTVPPVLFQSPGN